jgi:hypothetical protein
MTEPVEPTFTVEVQGFPHAADPAELVAQVSVFFGIPHEQAQQMVAQTPIRVKRNAPPAAAQVLVGQLLELGADVCVRNEQTGDEMAYSAGERPAAPPTPASGAIPSAPISSSPASPSPQTPGVPGMPLTGAGALAAAMAARKAKRDAPDSGASSVPAPPVPFVPLSSAPPPDPLSPSIAPTASDSPEPAPQALLAPCPACTRPTEKGGICGRCGWDQATKSRVCRQCQGKLELTSAPRLRRGLAISAIVGALVPGMGLFALYGAFGPILPIALAVGGVLLWDGLTTRYRCAKCNLDVGADRLQKKERNAILAVRSKSILTAALLFAGGLATPLFYDYSTPQISLSSFGIGCTVQLPRSYQAQAKQDQRQAKLKGETKRVQVLHGTPTYLPGPTYVLAYAQVAVFGQEAQIDQATLDAFSKDAATALLEGGSLADPKPGSFSGARLVTEGKLTGSSQGAKVSGYMRALLFEHDVFFIAVVSSSGDVDRALLDKLELDRSNKK